MQRVVELVTWEETLESALDRQDILAAMFQFKAFVIHVPGIWLIERTTACTHFYGMATSLSSAIFLLYSRWNADFYGV